jgi:acetamidase/formamidase
MVRGQMTPRFVLAVFIILGTVRLQPDHQRTHDLPLAPKNVHWGYFDARQPPALRIASGDRVRVETMIARGIQRLKDAGASDAEIPASLKTVEAAIADKSIGPHPLTGPIYVDGAERGDAIDVRIVAIEFLHPFGVEAINPGGGVLPGDFRSPQLRLLRWPPGNVASVPSRGGGRTSARLVWEPVPGTHVSLPLKPFFGTIGVAPAPSVGRVSSRAPGSFGGNLDNKDLVAGATLTLPVYVPGALLSIGDGHAMQGDGEVTGTAVETSLRGTFEVRLRKRLALRWPRAETPTHYISMGLDPDLDEATTIATREMVDFLAAEKKLSREDAYILCSMAGDLHVTQAVDGTKGVHMTLAKAIFK